MSAGRGRDRHVLAVFVKNDGERAQMGLVEEGADQRNATELVGGESWGGERGVIGVCELLKLLKKGK